ncbi:MAG: hypothetical protein JWO97_2442 [Acidobacteria bacterium]|nr:hypothetical protein [Acidobacteriota bacterium]
MKTARIALLLVMMLVLVACTERQRRTAMSAAANALLASLLDAQSNAPLTQSTFRASNVATSPASEPADVEPEPAAEETIAPIRCPLAPLPFAATRLSDVARHAAGVLDRIPSRDAAAVSRALACVQAKAEVISRCRYVRVRDNKVKGMTRFVFRAEITVPGDAIELSGVDDRAL